MSSERKAFELPYVFGGLSDPGVPDAPCGQCFELPGGTKCGQNYSNQPSCTDVPGDCTYKFDVGLALISGIVGGVIGGIFAT